MLPCAGGYSPLPGCSGISLRYRGFVLAQLGTMELVGMALRPGPDLSQRATSAGAREHQLRFPLASHAFCGSTGACGNSAIYRPECKFKSRKTGTPLSREEVDPVCSRRQHPTPRAELERNLGYHCLCRSGPAATTRAAVAIINLVVSFFIVLPSFGFAAAFPIRTDIGQLACHCAGARKALKTRSSDADFRHL